MGVRLLLTTSPTEYLNQSTVQNQIELLKDSCKNDCIFGASGDHRSKKSDGKHYSHSITIYTLSSTVKINKTHEFTKPCL